MGNEIKVRFSLTDFDCAPAVITERVGIEPSKTWVVGEPIMGGVRSHKENGWQLELRDGDASGIEDLTERLLQKLEVSGDAIAELARAFYAEIGCIVYATEYVPELHFSRRTLERIGRLGAEIDIDLYCSTSDETDQQLEKRASAERTCRG